MSRSYSDLGIILESILDSEYVYFQPPSNYKMNHPCIKYSMVGMDAKFANNRLYISKKKYSITIIDSDPDPESPIIEGVSKLPMTKFDRHYVADNLNHYVYTIYY